ncbi:SDR family NAD(P)-dependent oxidoreductase [Sorangium sp. So ce260]
MNTKEHDKVALITGANHGIGLELTRRLLSEGFQVIALNRSGFPVSVIIASRVGSVKTAAT